MSLAAHAGLLIAFPTLPNNVRSNYNAVRRDAFLRRKISYLSPDSEPSEELSAASCKLAAVVACRR